MKIPRVKAGVPSGIRQCSVKRMEIYEKKKKTEEEKTGTGDRGGETDTAQSVTW